MQNQIAKRGFAAARHWAAAWITRPAVILALSLAAALVYAGIVVVTSEGQQEVYKLYYFVPIGVPFAAFLLDRSAGWLRVGRLTLPDAARLLLDTVVVVVAVLRSLTDVPFVSGHALFLTYAALTVTAPTPRLLAAAVLLQVAYLKIFAWHDPTLFGGIIAAAAAALLFRGPGVLLPKRVAKTSESLES